MAQPVETATDYRHTHKDLGLIMVSKGHRSNNFTCESGDRRTDATKCIISPASRSITRKNLETFSRKCHLCSGKSHFLEPALFQGNFSNIIKGESCKSGPSFIGNFPSHTNPLVNHICIALCMEEATRGHNIIVEFSFFSHRIPLINCDKKIRLCYNWDNQEDTYKTT